MRICNGPRLVVPRAGIPRSARYSWNRWYLRYGHDAHTYDEYLARERARIRALPSVSVADRKRPTIYSQMVIGGASFRLVDGNGRSYGPRFTAPCAMQRNTCVRLVNRQPEDYHSLVSRMLKRAHRLILQTPI